MRCAPMRRLFAGLFGFVFAVSGLTRELVGTCPQHSGAHGNAGSNAAVPVAPVSKADAHAGHGGTHDVAPSVKQAGTVSAAAPPVRTSGDGSHGSHCDCIGDCCGCATVRLDGDAPIAIAVDTPIATPRLAYTVADRPAARVDIALPFATAPPATPAT